MKSPKDLNTHPGRESLWRVMVWKSSPAIGSFSRDIGLHSQPGSVPTDIGGKLGVDEIAAELLPEDKLEFVSRLGYSFGIRLEPRTLGRKIASTVDSRGDCLRSFQADAPCPCDKLVWALALWEIFANSGCQNRKYHRGDNTEANEPVSFKVRHTVSFRVLPR